MEIYVYNQVLWYPHLSFFLVFNNDCFMYINFSRIAASNSNWWRQKLGHTLLIQAYNIPMLIWNQKWWKIWLHYQLRFQFCICNLGNFFGVIAYSRTLAEAPRCSDPANNFRLAHQRSHCSSFTKRPLACSCRATAAAACLQRWWWSAPQPRCSTRSAVTSASAWQSPSNGRNSTTGSGFTWWRSTLSCWHSSSPSPLLSSTGSAPTRPSGSAQCRSSGRVTITT